MKKIAKLFRRSAVYSMRSTSKKILFVVILCTVCFLFASCIHRVIIHEPIGLECLPNPFSHLQSTVQPEQPYPLQTQPPFTVALDPGHGGMDTGAEGIVEELAVCEATIDALYTWLENDHNYVPVRTRANGEDLSNSNRVKNATESKASLLLSVHANCDPETRQSHGFECFPKPPGRVYAEESMRFAQCIAQKMGEAGHRLRGETGIRFAYYSGKRKRIVSSTDTKIRSDKSFGIVELPNCPAVLAEQCFLTNYDDVENWTGETGCARAARIYYEAICAYFGTTPLDPVA
ncbi:MAG: N-acetylmuramoyl-L-alanine amidase [Oscillospiraceae bacterium]|nr:N-acetylmuramoyl-L-alanine amidase [Oscillospiraceae bacterium]